MSSVRPPSNGHSDPLLGETKEAQKRSCVRPWTKRWQRPVGLESKLMCELPESFLPFCPGTVFPEIPSYPPTGNQGAEGPHLYLLGSHRASFLLFYLRCSDLAGPIPVWPGITSPARPWKRHSKEGTTPPEKGPLWACLFLQGPGVPRSRVPVLLV